MLANLPVPPKYALPVVVAPPEIVRPVICVPPPMVDEASAYIPLLNPMSVDVEFAFVEPKVVGVNGNAFVADITPVVELYEIPVPPERLVDEILLLKVDQSVDER